MHGILEGYKYGVVLRRGSDKKEKGGKKKGRGKERKQIEEKKREKEKGKGKKERTNRFSSDRRCFDRKNSLDQEEKFVYVMTTTRRCQS